MTESEINNLASLHAKMAVQQIQNYMADTYEQLTFVSLDSEDRRVLGEQIEREIRCAIQTALEREKPARDLLSFGD
jgi:hypothetical protein